jgi:hypothetical protein
VPTAAKPAATAASFATCFTVEALGRMDFFAFVGRFTFAVLLLFALALARFRLVFDLTRRFDEVFDLARFFAFFMILPHSIRALVQIGPQSVYWQAGGNWISCLLSPREPTDPGARFYEFDRLLRGEVVFGPEAVATIIGSEGKLPRSSK